MTTNDDMTPRQPDEDEPIEKLFSDTLDHVDETVARITDAEVNEHLRKVLSQSGYTGQLTDPWPQDRIELDYSMAAGIAAEHRAIADLAATARVNTELSSERLQQAQETLEVARQQAEQIVSAARDEADEALQQAAKMVRDARQKSEQIISDAHCEAEQVRFGTRSTEFSGNVTEAGLTSLIGLPRKPEFLKDLYAAAGAYTGLGAASPLTAEIVGAVVAAITAATLIERPASVGFAPYLRGQATHQDMAAVPRGCLTLARAPALPANGQMCAVFAVDIVGFSRPDRDDDIRRYLHQKLYDYLERAFDDSGIPWAKCFYEDRGDGALIVVPPGISFKGLIHPLPERLRSLIRRHNHFSCPAAGMQLRAAAHIGPVEHDGHGFVGTDVNFAFRMLDGRPLKRMLVASGAELGLIVSDYVYRDLICRHPDLVHPSTFRVARFQAKNTRVKAWTYLPGQRSVPAAPDADGAALRTDPREAGSQLKFSTSLDMPEPPRVRDNELVGCTGR
jgi:hypothetical protein